MTLYKIWYFYIEYIYKLYMDMYTCIYIVDGYEKILLYRNCLILFWHVKFQQNQSIQIIKDE